MVSILDIPGARTAVTPATRRLGESVDFVLPGGLVGCVVGATGVGKSTALRTALEQRGIATTWVDLPAAYSPKDLVQWIYTDVVGDPEEFTQRDLQDDLTIELAGSTRMVVIGNAERLTKEAAGQLEWLHGRSPGWALYFVGLPSALARISTEPHLMAALEDTVEIRSLSTAELHSVLPKIHDLFLTADRDLIDRIDAVLQGNLGLWAKFLRRAMHVRALAEQAGRPVPPLDVDLTRAALPGVVGARKPRERT